MGSKAARLKPGPFKDPDENALCYLISITSFSFDLLMSSISLISSSVSFWI